MVKYFLKIIYYITIFVKLGKEHRDVQSVWFISGFLIPRHHLILTCKSELLKLRYKERSQFWLFISHLILTLISQWDNLTSLLLLYSYEIVNDINVNQHIDNTCVCKKNNTGVRLRQACRKSAFFLRKQYS